MPQVLPNRRGAREIVHYDFRSPLTVAQQNIQLVGAPTVGNGLELDGTTQYAIAHCSLGLGDTWVKIVFDPDFAANDGVSHWLVAAGGSWPSQGSFHAVKHSGNSLLIYFGTAYVYSTLANYSAYWNVGQKNTLIISFGLGASTNRAMYLNGNKLTASVGTTAVSQVISDIVIGASDNYASKFDGTIHQVIIGEGQITDEDEARLYAGDIGESLRADEPLIHLPCRRVQVSDAALADTLVDGDMEAVGTAAWFSPELLSKQGGAAVGLQCLGIGLDLVSGVVQATQSGTGFDTASGNKYRLSGYVRCNQAVLDHGSTRIYQAGYGFVSPYILLPATTSWQFFSEEFTATRTAKTAVGGFAIGLNGQYWEFDELVFQRLVDSDNTPNIGSLGTDGDALLGSDGTTVAEYPDLLMPKGFDFDGSNDLLTIPDNAALSFGDGSNDSPFSISALADIQGSSFTIVSKMGADSTTHEYYFGTDGADKLEARLYSGLLVATNYTGRKYNAQAVVEGYHHYMLTYGDDIKLYIDGVRVDDSGVAGEGGYTAMLPRGADVLIGKRLVLQSTGDILEPKIWNRELSPLEASYESAKALAELNR